MAGQTKDVFEGVETRELLDRRAALEEELATIRRGPLVLFTKAGAHARISETFALLEKTIAEREAALRHRLATVGGPLPLEDVAGWHALLAILADATLAERLHALVDREPLRGEGDPFTAEPKVAPRAREVVEAELLAAHAELDRRTAVAELEAVDEQRKGLLARIGGRS